MRLDRHPIHRRQVRVLEPGTSLTLKKDVIEYFSNLRHLENADILACDYRDIYEV